MNKKGNTQVMNTLLPAIVTLIIVAITLTLLANINLSFRNGLANNAATTTSNQTLTWAGNNTPIKLNAEDVLSVVIYNNGTRINEGRNYTVNSVGGSVTFLNESGNHVELVTNTLNATYSWSYGSAARNITGRGLTSVNTTVSYLPTIALVVVASLIIGIVFVMFRKYND